eukprot:gb/GECG01002887.1/.p1 GENE.gb/GECG01002887.1/~~gb/GECG01002887.1/.p1  ORF type:complete len:186 (+),score=44.89 gb/GECG01002887.1/:1-558(+)
MAGETTKKEEDNAKSSSASSTSKKREREKDESGAQEQQFYEKAGQKYPTPSPGAGERVFYETLLKEKPECDIALVWSIEHGILSKEEAAKRYSEYERARQRVRSQTISANQLQQNATASATKAKGKTASSSATKASTSSSNSTPKKQKKGSSRDAGKVVDTTAVSAGDVGMSVGGDEGIGTMNLG